MAQKDLPKPEAPNIDDYQNDMTDEELNKEELEKACQEILEMMERDFRNAQYDRVICGNRIIGPKRDRE
jgi:predicted secreted protein